MALRDSAFKGLTDFVTCVQTNKEYVVDPYNNFTCSIIMVPESPQNAQKFISMATDFLTFKISKAVETNKELAQTGMWSGINSKLLNLHNENSIHHLIEGIEITSIDNKETQQDLLHGKFPTMLTYPLIINGTVKIKFLNIAPQPIIETIMYPWMAACSGVGADNKALPRPSDLDYPRADMEIKFPHLKLNSDKAIQSETINSKNIPFYKFFNLRPVAVEPYSPSNKPHSELYRGVTFAFDYFTILSDDAQIEYN